MVRVHVIGESDSGIRCEKLKGNKTLGTGAFLGCTSPLWHLRSEALGGLVALGRAAPRLSPGGWCRLLLYAAAQGTPRPWAGRRIGARPIGSGAVRWALSAQTVSDQR